MRPALPPLLLVLALAGCAAPLERTPPVVAAGPGAAAALPEAGARPLRGGEIRQALAGRTCSGETAAGLFEVEYRTAGLAVLTPADGRSIELTWSVDETGAYCEASGSVRACRRVLAAEGTFLLLDGEGRHVASLVCT
jgi:hypothetical protein